jgi:HEAT repeat protein
MKPNWLRTLASQPALRIGLAVLLILIGLAPVGAPILSDSSWRASSQEGGVPVQATPVDPFAYRIPAQGDALTQIERSDDGGKTWHAVAGIPENVVEVMPVPADEQVVYARSNESVWVSRDGGATWTHTSQLPSRPLSLAVTSRASDAIFVGTESVGLAVSRDGGETWQVVNDPTLTMSGMAPIAVTALRLDPQDETIIYAATAVWTGTSTARLTPVGTFVSVDGGRLWLQMDQLPLDGGPAARIDTVEGRLLAVVVDNGQNAVAQEMKLTPELLDELNSADPVVRGSVARALGLIGDSAAVQPLLDRLNDEDLLVGDRVAEALARLGDPNVAPIFMDMLSSDTEAVRARAAYGLGLMKREAATDLLAERLRVDRPLVARRAAEALANIGTPAAMTALTVPLADVEMTPARHAAMAGLEQAGPIATDALVGALQSHNPAQRSHAAEMLGWVRSPESVDALAAALQDDDATVRTEAAWALGEIGTAEARAELTAAQQNAADDATKTALANAQGRAMANTPAARPAPAFGEGFVAALSSVPATSWTFFALFLALALALLLLTPLMAGPVREERNR